MHIDELKAQPRWVCWHYVPNPKAPQRPRKVPMRPDGDGNAKSDDPRTWGSYAQAQKTRERKGYDGIGYQLGEGVMGIDIDHCVTDGHLNELAQRILRRVPTYAEFSPSGTGLHLLARGALPEDNRGRRKGAVEAYGQGRYFTFTGNRVPGTPDTLAEVSTAEMAAFIAEFMGAAPQQAKQAPSAPQPVDVMAMDNAKLLNKIRASQRGPAFCKLWAGDTSAHNGDDSAADMALCNMLAFWTGCDAARMDDLFRQSGLMRPKWDERHGADTYGALTIAKAIRDCPNRYTGKRPQSAPVEEGSPFYPFEQAYKAVEGYASERGRLMQERTDKQSGEISVVPLANFTPLIREEITRDDGAEVRKELLIDGIDERGHLFPEVLVPMRSFPGMSWVPEKFGIGANIYPGQTKRDQLRFAVQNASLAGLTHRTVYAHMGWRTVDGTLCYLYNGGAIGKDGLSVELEGTLAAYSLADAGIGVREAAQASRDFLDVGTLRVTAPLLCAMYLAPLCDFLGQCGHAPAFATYLVGGTGTHKTTISALALSHFGRFGNKRATASFADTANSIRRKAFLVKDAPLLVDDFHPSADPKAHRLMTETAQQLARAWGDLGERGRMQADGTLKTAEPPRGLGMISGEDMPQIQESGGARYYCIEMHGGDVPVSDALTELQHKAEQGYLSQAMRDYIEQLRVRAEGLPGQLGAKFEQNRSAAMRALPGVHGRIHETLAWLMLGLEGMLGYWQSCSALTQAEAAPLRAQIIDALYLNASEQQRTMSGEKPVELFLSTLRELLQTGAVWLADAKYPEMPAMKPGELIGYLDPPDFRPRRAYLLPQSAYSAVYRRMSEQGGRFPVSRTQLWKRMDEARLITSRDTVRGRDLTPTKTLGGHPTRLLWMDEQTLFGGEEQMAVGGG